MNTGIVEKLRKANNLLNSLDNWDVHTKYTNKSLFDLLLIFAYNVEPNLVIAYASKNDTVIINKVLNDSKIKKAFPAGTCFLWSINTDNSSGYYELYAINNFLPDGFIDNSVIQSSGLSQSSYGDMTINISLKDKYHNV
ncbi:MAG: hypothetical protein LBL90_01100 [Prevotellaceae bacterium]|nr:hypothetical protein [Prevotellaceae bacterium]